MIPTEGTGKFCGQDEQVFARWSEIHWSRQCKQRPLAKSDGQVVLGPEGRTGALTKRSQDPGCKGTWGAMEGFQQEVSQSDLPVKHWLEWSARMG